MTTSFTLMLSVWLLILAVQGCCGDNQVSLKHRDAAMVTAMKQVGQAMKCFGETTQERLILQKQTKDEVTTLTREVLDLKNQLTIKDQKVDKISQILLDMNSHICDKNTNGASCDQETIRLKTLLESKEQMNRALQEQFDVLTKVKEENDLKIDALNEEVLELKKLLADKNKTVENHVNWTQECEKKQHLEQIKPVVHQFRRNRDWTALKQDLDVLLDHKSAEYIQLQDVRSVWSVGWDGYTELASLLLCAGLPVHMMDRNGVNTMLHGAAQAGQLEMAKLLLDWGSSVHARGGLDWTPVILAAYGGHLDMVKYLVQAGADTTDKDKDGHNALYWAKSWGHTAVVQYLQQLPH